MLQYYFGKSEITSSRNNSSYTGLQSSSSYNPNVQLRIPLLFYYILIVLFCFGRGFFFFGNSVYYILQEYFNSDLILLHLSNFLNASFFHFASIFFYMSFFMLLIFWINVYVRDRGYSHHNRLIFPKIIIYLSVIVVCLIQVAGFLVSLGFLIKSVVVSASDGQEHDYTFQYINVSILLFHGVISLVAVAINIGWLLIICACWRPSQLNFHSRNYNQHQTKLIVVIIVLAVILVFKALTNFVEASLLLTSELCPTTEFLVTCINGFFLGLVPALLVTEFVDLFRLEDVLYPEKQRLLVRDEVKQVDDNPVSSRRTSVDTSCTPNDYPSRDSAPYGHYQQENRQVVSPLTIQAQQ